MDRYKVLQEMGPTEASGKESFGGYAYPWKVAEGAFDLGALDIMIKPFRPHHRDFSVGYILFMRLLSSAKH